MTRPSSLGTPHAVRQDKSGLVTSPSDHLLRFIGSSFRSVWALELLLLIKREPRHWSRGELISTLRASELVVNKAIDELVAAGFASIEGDGARYLPATDDIARHMKQVEKLYAARPDAVRRAIVSTAASGATAFADAFRLRKD
jgi:hypothetical protein